MQQPTPSTSLTPPRPGTAPVASVPSQNAPLPADVYQGLRAQRRELARQLEWLEEKRSDLQGELQDPSVTGPNRAGLEQRLGDLDQRITAIDKQMGETEIQLSRAAAVPGAVTEVPPSMGPGGGPPDAAFVMGAIFMVLVLFPLSIALARRLWRRGTAAVAALPAEVSRQLTQLEQAVSAIAIEVERIGEGQRFMSKLMAEAGPKALGAGAAEPIQVKSRDAAPERRGPA